jgi:CheY-like chemotaxis protein
VDDNDANRKLARDVLRAGGFATLEAATAAEAISIAGRHLPDVVLMDLRLPDMDGATAARHLGREPRTAGIPVVALTSSAYGAGDEWVRDAGFVGHLEKPISVRTFAYQVRAFCSGEDS